MNVDQILLKLTQIENAAQAIRDIMNQTTSSDHPEPVFDEPRIIKYPAAKSLSKSDLSPIPDIGDPSWPVAVNSTLIVSPDDFIKKQIRAIQINSLIAVDMTQKNVLDIGCGDGLVVNEISSKAKNSIGFDVIKNPHWNYITSSKDNDKLKFTDLKSVVEDHKPYDFIIMFDMLDHLLGSDPYEFMAWVRELLHDNGQIFIRFHPWTAKHGGHLYEQCNKAYVHLALTPDETAGLHLKTSPNLKVVRPLAFYEDLISKSGLKSQYRKGTSESVDQYVLDNLLNRIMEINWAKDIEPSAAAKILSIQFVDYLLSKA